MFELTAYLLIILFNFSPLSLGGLTTNLIWSGAAQYSCDLHVFVETNVWTLEATPGKLKGQRSCCICDCLAFSFNAAEIKNTHVSRRFKSTIEMIHKMVGIILSISDVTQKWNYGGSNRLEMRRKRSKHYWYDSETMGTIELLVKMIHKKKNLATSKLKPTSKSSCLKN